MMEADAVIERRKVYEKYLKQAVPSEEMSSYIMHACMEGDDIVDIIYYSPVMTLEEKAQAISELPDIMADDSMDFMTKCQICGLYLNTARALLEEPGIFTMEMQYFDKEAGQQESTFEGVFSSFDDVIKEIALWEEDAADRWFDVTLWDKDSDGKMQDQARYIIVHTKPIYCDLEERALELVKPLIGPSIHSFDMLYMTDLNLPIPFKKGDIVEVGSPPFVPRQKILITDVGDNRDCCCVQGLGRTASGKYETGAVKHGHVGIGRSNCYIIPSLLYEMKKYDGPYDPEEGLLWEVADIIRER